MSRTINGGIRTYQGSVIFRMLGSDEKKMKDFTEEYEAARIWGPVTEPTPQDYKMAEMWGKGMLVREISQKLGVKQSKVQTGVRRVALYKLRNDYK